MPIGLLLGIFGVLLVLIVIVQVMARTTYFLSGTSELTLESKAVPRGDTGLTLDQVKFHRISELSAETQPAFGESPRLTKLVESGKLPPVGARLPENPLVITPPEQAGPYGGDWTRFGISPGDISQFRHRIAYEAMLRWDPLGRQLWPNLAWQWEVTEEGKVFTFHLRRGVRWSDGQPFSADDIIFWYEDVLLNKKLTPGIGPTWKRGGKRVLVEKLDKYTVRFTFAQPHGRFLQLMAGEPGYNILSYPAHYLKKFHPNYRPKEELEAAAQKAGYDFWYQIFQNECSWRNKNLPTLWAWTLKNPPPSRPVIFERNPYYWKVDHKGNQLPYLDRVTFEIYDLETINLKAINGEVGMQGRHLHFHNYQLFMSNQKKGGYRVLRWLDGGTGNLVLCPNLNHKDKVLAKIFADLRFRQALSLAINRAEINEVLYLGLGTPRQISPPAFSPFYDPAAESAFLKYDPAEADRLLDEMGLGKRSKLGYRLRPDGQVLAIQLETSSNVQGARSLQMIAEYLQAIGIKAELKLMARQLFKARMKALIHDIGVWKGAGQLNPVVDPRYFIPYSKASIHAIKYSQWFRSRGRKGPQPPPGMVKAIQLYRQIEETSDPAQQERLVREIVDLNSQNLWVIGTIGDVPQIFVVADTFRNVPKTAVASWVVRTPGNTAPECYALDPSGKGD